MRKSVQTQRKKVPGIAGVLTYKDVPQERFTFAGQTYPELSPYDRLILYRHIRFVGDAVAIVAGETEKAVDKAMKIIKVRYELLEPVLDFHKAKDNPVLLHPEDNWESTVGADNKRNLCASKVEALGDVDAVLADCKYVVERTYHTKANQQAILLNLPSLYVSGLFRQVKCGCLYPGSFPCQKNPGTGFRNRCI